MCQKLFFECIMTVIHSARLACKLIINSSLPIGCQFIWETKLTLKSHKIILEKSWWSFLVVVVAIVIAVVIAVVVVVVIAIVIVKV